MTRRAYRLVSYMAWWWGALYVPAILILVSCTGQQPNWEKFWRMAARAHRIRLIEVDLGRLEA